MATTMQMSEGMTSSYRDIKCNSLLLAPLARKPQPAKAKRTVFGLSTRATHTKVRSGCRTCKARHVKCDETKPACTKCSSTGRKCDGYEANTETALARSTSSVINPHFVQYVFGTDIPGDARARRTFHYFRCRSSNAMFRYFESSCIEADFWDGLVLRISHTNPTVRHAILALGALYEEYETSSSSRGSTPVDGTDLHSAFALKQYNKAVQLLSADLSADNPPLESILASCLIFICLEFLRDDPQTALSHLKAGLHILNEAGSNATAVSPRGNAKSNQKKISGVDKSLPVLFTRLHSQAMAHGCPKSDFAPMEIQFAPVAPIIPTSFTTIVQARLVLEDVFSSLFDILRKIRLVEEPPIYVTAPSVYEPLAKHYVRLFDEWRSSFEVLITHLRAETTIDKRQENAITLMWVHYNTVRLVLETVEMHEDGYDAYSHVFAEILSLSRKVIEGTDPESGDLPMLSVEFGLICPLFVILWKCRDERIRLPALELLRRAPVREGIWRRESALEYAEWKIRREEMEAVRLGWVPGSGVLMPGEARVFWEELKEKKKEDGSVVTMVTFRRRNGDILEVLEEEADIGIEMGDLI